MKKKVDKCFRLVYDGITFNWKPLILNWRSIMEDNIFDQSTGEDRNTTALEAPEGTASILINGSYVSVETGAPFLQTVKNAALDAGFGKFRCYVNGVEVRKSTAPTEFDPDMRVELRPYDEAG